MARQVTLLQLRQRVRQRANMENSQFVTDGELLDYLNESLAELYDLLVAAYGQEYFRSTHPFATTAGAAEYALPNDFYQLISVDVNLGGNQLLTARRFMEFERNKYNFWPMWTYGAPIWYRLRGSNSTFPNGSIAFEPTPSGNATITVYYVPAFSRLFGDFDSFDGISGWEEYAVVDAAVKCLVKEESDVSVLLVQKEGLRQRIMAMAPSRDENAPDRVHDVESQDFPWR